MRAECNADAATHHEHIVDDDRQTAWAFDIEPTHLAGNHSVVPQHNYVSRRRYRNNGSLLKVGEVTILCNQVAFVVKHPDRVCFIRTATLK